LAGKFIGIIRSVLELRRAIKKSRPDVVISFIAETSIYTLFAAVPLGFPVLVAERIYPKYSFQKEYDIFGIINRLGIIIRSLTYPFSRRIIVQTNKAYECFPKFLQRKISVIPNSLFPSNEAEEADSSLSSPCILAIGRLAQQKRFDLLIEAFSRIAYEFPQWSLYIFGEGKLRDALQTKIHLLNLSDKVHLPGITKTPRLLMKEADIFVLSSDYEGFPTVLLEAMTSGCAVIATDCLAGPGEIIHDRVSGILVEPGDISELADTLSELMASPDRRKALSMKATDVNKAFHFENIMQVWEDLICAI